MLAVLGWRGRTAFFEDPGRFRLIAPILANLVGHGVEGRMSRTRKRRLWIAARTFVTPLAGFVMSDLYLSNEIEKHSWKWLNRKSRKVTKMRLRKIRQPTLIYCQVDQIEEFARSYLPVIRVPFILLTGKIHLPGLERSEALETVLKNRNLITWFSQNQRWTDLAIKPFPYGLSFDSAVEAMQKADTLPAPHSRKKEIFVPFASIHDHLSDEDAAPRLLIRKYMAARLPLAEYLDELSHHMFSISPPGDRPDTFRHWEIISMGGVPVGFMPGPYEDLFGDTFFLTEDPLSLLSGETPLPRFTPESDRARFGYWNARVRAHMKNRNVEIKASRKY